MKKSKPKKKTYAQLKRELDRVFSLWVRWKNADKNGLVECFTCGVKKPVKQMQAGHFIPRHYLKLRWCAENVRPQDYRCNVALRGNYPVFAYRLGQEMVGWLIKNKHQTVKFSAEDLQARINHYKDALSILVVRT